MSQALEEVWAIVLAAGAGRRLGRLKQFDTVGGRRLVDRSVAAARTSCDRIILVLPPGLAWDGDPVDRVVEGGAHQAESVRAALAMIPGSATIAVICDAAHPLAAPRLFAAVIGAVLDGADGAAPTIPILEVVQRVTAGQIGDTLPKHDLVQTQTPQAFRLSALRAAHAEDPYPVENSGLLAERGYVVRAVPGDPANLHVATERDLHLADLLARVLDLE